MEFPPPNIFHALTESKDMQIRRVDCIFFSPNIKFLANMYYHIQFQIKFTGFLFDFALTCHVTYCHESLDVASKQKKLHVVTLCMRGINM